MPGVTIRAGKRGAVSILVVGGVTMGLTAVAALLMSDAGLLRLVGLCAVPLGLAALAFLLPISLTDEGGELVLRSTGKTTRVRTTDIARCAQVGARWIFSDASGAQLLSLPGLRFDAADVAALCQAARIEFQGPSLQPVDKLRAAVRSAWGWIVIGLVVVIFFGGLAVVIYFLQTGARDTLSRYHAAPLCSRLNPASASCRTQAQARVVAATPDRSEIKVDLAVEGAGTYTAWLRNQTAPNVDTTVDVELWNGKVTVIDGKETIDNPEQNPNLTEQNLFGVLGLFILAGLAALGYGWLALSRTRSKLRQAAAVATGFTGSVHQVHPDMSIPGAALPPCGVAHYPKEVLYLPWDRSLYRKGVISALVVALPIVAVLILLAILVSAPIFGTLAALGVGYLALDMFGDWRARKVSGVFADDLHVGKISSANGRIVRKVFDRKAVLECVSGTRFSVVGVDGSTLFWATLLTDTEIDQFVQFVGCRLVNDKPAQQPDSIAVAAIPTPIGVLPLRVRRAAGVMQSAAGLVIGLSIINIPLLLPRIPAERRLFSVELLASLLLYGAIYFLLGWRLAKGRPWSREASLIGGAGATGFLVVSMLLIGLTFQELAVFAGMALGLYALIFYWLREPMIRPTSPPPPPLQ